MIIVDELFEFVDGGHSTVAASSSAKYSAKLSPGVWYAVESTVDTYIKESADASTAADANDFWLRATVREYFCAKSAKPYLASLRAGSTSGTIHIMKCRPQG